MHFPTHTETGPTLNKPNLFATSNAGILAPLSHMLVVNTSSAITRRAKWLALASKPTQRGNRRLRPTEILLLAY